MQQTSENAHSTPSDDFCTKNVGLWDSKEAADAFGAGVWRSGSELRDKIDALLAGELSREELDVQILHMPTSP